MALSVLHVEAGCYLYGGAKQVLYIMEGLQKRGVNNMLAAPIGSEVAGAAHTYAQVHEIKMKGDLDMGLKRRLAALIRQHQPDLVHIHSRRGADVWGGLAACQLKVPCVLSRRVDNPEKPYWAKTKYKLYNHVIAISEGIRQVLLAEGIHPDHVTCVRSAVDPQPYLHAVDRFAFAKEFNLPSDALVIGVVAQLIARKGHRYLIEAMPQILKEYPTAHVLFFGQGALAEELVELIKQKGLSDHIQLVGFRTDLPEWLGGLDLLVHPAEMEGLGVSLLQASAAKVPIIASNAGGLPEAVVDGETGLLFPVGDVSALAKSVNQLLGDVYQREQYGTAGRQRILNEFSVDAMVDGNLKIYQKVLGLYN